MLICTSFWPLPFLIHAGLSQHNTTTHAPNSDLSVSVRSAAAWRTGWRLREKLGAVPDFLQGVHEDIVAAGRAAFFVHDLGLHVAESQSSKPQVRWGNDSPPCCSMWVF